MGAWHMPYRKEAFGQLKALFPEVEISPLNPSQGDLKKENVKQIFSDKQDKVIVNSSIKKVEIRYKKIPQLSAKLYRQTQGTALQQKHAGCIHGFV